MNPPERAASGSVPSASDGFCLAPFDHFFVLDYCLWRGRRARPIHLARRMSVEARSPDPATPGGSNASGSDGRPRRPRRRARGIAFRAVGRKMALFAAANAVISLFLPWMVIELRGVNAFALGSEPWLLAMFDATWVAHAVWAVLGASVLVAVLVLVDRVRSLGTFLGFVALAAGGGMMFLAVMVFETVLPLRQVGVIACGVGGLVMVGSGAVLFRASSRGSPP